MVNYNVLLTGQSSRLRPQSFGRDYSAVVEHSTVPTGL